ncbi:hypothetical protein [Phaeobacter sp. LSS9]|uniref:hypothetical protein n=1 Tax=unclassified Phaeobacter TaxID=2621772 RepID=UPI0013C354EA|nr:hypothetical protein [Phaeobacter sp. LSS9]
MMKPNDQRTALQNGSIPLLACLRATLVAVTAHTTPAAQVVEHSTAALAAEPTVEDIHLSSQSSRLSQMQSDLAPHEELDLADAMVNVAASALSAARFAASAASSTYSNASTPALRAVSDAADTLALFVAPQGQKVECKRKAQSASFQDAKLSPSTLFQTKLLSPFEGEELLMAVWQEFDLFSSNKADWSFWRDWYQGFLDGKPLDWVLQRRVALIDDAIWDAGPEAVAAEIERIRSRYDLEREIANLKEQLTTFQHSPATALIGDNGGPPLEDAPARAFQTDLALIWKQVEELEEEIAKPSPSPLQLEKIAKALWDICLRMAAYCGSIADGMIREGTKELAKAGAKWTARATAVTVTAQTEGVQSVVKAIGAFVKTLQ